MDSGAEPLRPAVGIMSRVLRIAFTLGAVCAAAIVYYRVRPEPVVAQARSDTVGYKPQKAISEQPNDAGSIAGHYYEGDGTGYNVYLTLRSNNTYTATWHGCLGAYGEAFGDWKLSGGLVVFAPSMETDMMRGHLKGLEVLRFQGHWIFLSTNKSDREFYDKWGVSVYSCFQNTNNIFRGP